jgi:O-antigen ligase
VTDGLVDSERPRTAILLLGVTVCALAFISDPWLDVEGFAFPKELALGVTGTLAATLVLWRQRELRLSSTDLALTVFLVLGVVSAATVAVNGWMAWRAVAMTLAGGAVYWAACRAGQGTVLVCAAGLTVFIAVVVILEGHGFLTGLSLPNRAPGGVLGNRNYAAHFIVLGLPLLFALGLGSRATGARLLIAGGVALSTAAVVLTRSRAAWLALLVLAVALPVLSRFMPRSLRAGAGRTSLILAGGLALGVAVAVLVPNKLAFTSSSASTLGRLVETDKGSGLGRVRQYGNTLRLIADHPLLGVGPGNWFARYPAYAPPGDPTVRPEEVWNTPAHATGDWLGMAAERGLPATLALLGFFFLVARWAWRRLREATAIDEVSGAVASLGLLAALLIMGSLDAVFQLALPTFFTFLVLGAAGVNTTGKKLVLPRGLALGAMLVVLVAGSLAGWMQVRQIQAALLVTGDKSQVDWVRVSDTGLGQYRPLVQAALGVYHTDCEAARALARRSLAHNPGSRIADRLVRNCRPDPEPGTR